MNDIPKTLGIIALNGRDGVSEVLDRFEASARQQGFAVVDTRADSYVAGDLDLIVGIGGDGTLMRAAHLAHELAVPVIGINLGTVGYLTEVEPSNVEDMLERLAAREALAATIA